MTNRNKWLGMCILAVVMLAVMAVLPQAVLAQNATYEGAGNGTLIYTRYWEQYRTAKIFKMNVSGTLYDSYCIDLFTSISQGDNLTVNGSLAEGDPSINWTAVVYILNMYDYSTAEDKDLEAAAIQAAIWYFCTEPEGQGYPGSKGIKYQFMTDDMTGTYDGHAGPAGSDVRVRALVIINDTKENGTDFQFPTTIDLTPEKNLVNASEDVTITATVYDQDNDPLPGITVKFDVTEGTGTINPEEGTTNDPEGQVQVTFTASDPPDNSTVVAWPEGNYGTLLRGDLFVIPRQNVSTVTLIPRSIEDSTILAPIPELPTIVLTSTGLLALVGYIRYRRRGKQQ
jgi:hypothetical protein